MNKFKLLLNKPEYFFNFRWINRNYKNRNNSTVIQIKLPWHLEISIFNDQIGKSIRKIGVHELTVSEILYRIIEPRNIFIDIGANIGYMTSIAVKKMKGKGKIFCFEPHPVIFKKLEQNIFNWKSNTIIELFNIGLSDRKKLATLNETNNFSTNMGTASISDSTFYTINANKIQCQIDKLDNIIEAKTINEAIIIKIDIEGHELNAIKGMENLLTSKNVKHIIFEDHNKYPSDVSSLLENYEYKIFGLEKNFWGPKLSDPRITKYLPWESPNYVATQDEYLLKQKMRNKGWEIFKN